MPKPSYVTTSVPFTRWSTVQSQNGSYVETPPTVNLLPVTQCSVSVPVAYSSKPYPRKGKRMPWQLYLVESLRVSGGPRVLRTYSEYVSWYPDGNGGTYGVTTRYLRGASAGGNPYVGAAPPEYPRRNEVYDIAVAKLFSSLRDERTQFNALVTLGEAKETVQHLFSTGRRLAEAALALKKGKVMTCLKILTGKIKHRDVVPIRYDAKVRRIRRSTKTWRIDEEQSWTDAAASAWMELSFAWSPLVSDLDSAVKYLAEKRVGKTTCVYRVSRQHSLTDTSIRKVGSGLSAVDSISESKASSCRLTYELQPKWLQQPSTMGELGFHDLPSGIWNLLPLSFVWDYFLNVSQVLESLYEFNQWTVVRGLMAQRDSGTLVHVMESNYKGWEYSSDPMKWVRHHSRSVRTPLYGLPDAVPLRIKIVNPFDLKNGPLTTVAILLRSVFLAPLKARNPY